MMKKILNNEEKDMELSLKNIETFFRDNVNKLSPKMISDFTGLPINLAAEVLIHFLVGRKNYADKYKN
jgi:hypothetical protein